MHKLNPLGWFKGSVAPEFRKSRILTKSLPLGANDALGAFLMHGSTGGGTPASALELYNDSTAVSIPVNMVALGFSSLTPVLEGPDGKIITKHEVLELLQSPSPFFDGCLFLETIAKDFLITGETELVAIGGVTRPPLELQPVSPRNVSVVEGTGGIAQSFQISGNTLAGTYQKETKRGQVRYYDGGLRELKQIRNYSTKSNGMLRGQSPLVSAAAEARQDILGNEHNVSLLEKGGRLSLVFHYEEDMDTDDYDETARRINARFGGASKAGQIAVSAGGKMNVDEFGVNNKDMDFAVLKKMAQHACALTYMVPLPLISTDASTFNNYSQAKLALFDDAVLPLADRLFGGLSSFLLTRYGLDPSKYRITYDMDSITALAMRRNEELKLRKDLGIETTNEMRQGIGREPVDGGDNVLAPANLIPIGTDLFTADEPRVVREREDEDE